MPKLKTHKGAAKRFKKTGTGKILRGQTKKRHILTSKTKKVKKKVERVAKAITSFTVDYNPATDSVTVELSGAPTFPLGGQLTVLPGVTTGSGDVLSGTTLFKITAGGKKIVPG